MARHYVKNPAGSTPVTDPVLADARAKAEAAAAALRDAEQGDPAAPGGDEAYAAAQRASVMASRRVETLERLRAVQVEQAGKRAEAVKAAARDLKSTALALTASRDAVAAAAAEHLRSLAALAAAAEAHNQLLSKSRARLAAAGLRVKDDLLDEGAEHPEGVLNGPGMRLAGIDWTPVAAGGVAAYACRQVFAAAGPGHPLYAVGKHVWRAHEVEHRADGLKVPVLAAATPETPRRAHASRPPASTMKAPTEGNSSAVRIGV